MIFPMRLLKMGLAHMGIYLRRGDGRMAQHFLYRPQVRAVLHKMRGERMAERMRRDGFMNSRRQGRSADEPQELNILIARLRSDTKSVLTDAGVAGRWSK